MRRGHGLVLQPFAKMLAVPDLGGFKNKQHKMDPNVGFYDLCPRYHIMPSKNTISKPSKNSAMRKSTRKVVKTTRAQQAEPESEEEDPALAKVTPANDEEDIYINDKEEAAFRRREEEEESEEEADEDHRDDEEEGDDEEDEDEDEPQTVPVVPQKRKMGKEVNKPTSKPFCSIILLLHSLSCLQNV
jgi:hypothetical protein